MYTYFTAIIRDSLRVGVDSKPIYLSTKSNVIIDGNAYLDLLSIPETRERGIEPSDTTATASKMDIRVENPNSEFSVLIYERMNSVGTLFWNEKIYLVN